MGLDMYLRASRNYSKFSNDEPLANTIGQICNLPTTVSNDVTVRVEVGYWRKANAIHWWLANKCFDDPEKDYRSYLSIDVLHELKSTCLTVIDTPDLGPVLLPTGDGFFFGSTEYDQHYIGQLHSTVDIVNAAIEVNECGFNNFEYYASW